MHANLFVLASRPLPTRRAMQASLMFVLALIGVLACKVAVANHADDAMARAVAAHSTSKSACFEAIVELDEGYGVTGRDTRLVCENAD
ncbi:MAG TPA: hypothetical protein VK446_04660 [Methylocystis sp.]|nr:hypothetical protein [Methylocystis sp.]